jgi:hypothetical protein
MPTPPRTPGISRDHRISGEGLQRLGQMLARGGQVSDAVLAQWIRRYGEPARALVREAGRYHEGLETIAPPFPPGS